MTKARKRKKKENKFVVKHFSSDGEVKIQLMVYGPITFQLSRPRNLILVNAQGTLNVMEK